MRQEYTYFILAPVLNKVKIGKAHKVSERLDHLQTGSPELLQLLRVVPFDEREMHELFKRFRVHREWFEYTGELKAFVEGRLTADQVREVGRALESEPTTCKGEVTEDQYWLDKQARLKQLLLPFDSDQRKSTYAANDVYNERAEARIRAI